MPNIEKVIKGLECCTFILGKRKCNECPYQKGLPDNGCYQLQDDFHALLKEQGTANIKEPDCRICGQSHCKYYHETRKPTDCKSYVRCD